MSENIQVHLVDVKITPDAKNFLVTPVWANVDRPVTGGMLVKNRKLAERLERAIRARVAMVGVRVLRDINGKTYVDVRSNVSGRTLNADLRRLGF